MHDDRFRIPAWGLGAFICYDETMPKVLVNDVHLNYAEQGGGSETILFVHGLLFNHRLFDAQVDALKSAYRCISVDLRGQGDSEITRDGYGMDSLTEDVRAFIKALDCSPCHFVGLSMGGFIGLRLAIRYPGLLTSLSLLDTTADPEPEENLLRYRLMAATGRIFGYRPIINRLMPIMFAQQSLEDPSMAPVIEHWKQQISSNNKAGSTRAAMGVIKREGVYERLDRIKTPTLIIVGDQDVATPVIKSERMAKKITDSELKVIPGAGHSSCIEKPEVVTQELAEFIEQCNQSTQPAPNCA